MKRLDYNNQLIKQRKKNKKKCLVELQNQMKNKIKYIQKLKLCLLWKIQILVIYIQQQLQNLENKKSLQILKDIHKVKLLLKTIQIK